jgi:tRNA (guanine-N7-)-methyltransferase
VADELRREVTSFVHHRARLTEGQQSAWERWWPERGADVDEVLDGTRPWDPAAWFGRAAPVVLEIGSGMGESTAALAAAHPEIDHVAVEVFEPGLAALLMRMAELDLHNLTLLRGDAVRLLREAVPEGSLDGIRVFFPDPWPKRRHRKRRLVQAEFVALAASRLRSGGFLHLATDWEDYATQMLAVVRSELSLAGAAGGFTPRPAWRPVSKFEQRALVEGRDVRELLVEKR